MTLLETVGLTKAFGGLKAVRDMDLQVQQGEILGLIGPNGSGKSTFINLVTGFETPSAGTIKYKGRRIEGLKPHQLAGMGVVKTFQLGGLFPTLSVEENILAACHLMDRSDVPNALLQTTRYRRDEKSLRKKAAEILELVGLTSRRHSPARNLSHGEHAPVKIGMALATNPSLVLLDEPAAGMNLAESQRLALLIQTLHKQGIGIVLVEHNMRVVMQLCTRIVVISFGVKIADGAPQEVAGNPTVIEAYLGSGTAHAQG